MKKKARALWAIFCPSPALPPICSIRWKELAERLERIEEDGQARSRLLLELSQSFKNHIMEEESERGELVKLVTELLSQFKRV